MLQLRGLGITVDTAVFTLTRVLHLVLVLGSSGLLVFQSPAPCCYSGCSLGLVCFSFTTIVHLCQNVTLLF